MTDAATIPRLALGTLASVPRGIVRPGYDPQALDVGIVHLQTHGEIDLPLVGEQLDLVDGETGEILRGVTRAEMATVRSRIRDERERVQRYCRAHGIPLVQTVTGAPTDLEHLVLGLFRTRGLLR